MPAVGIDQNALPLLFPSDLCLAEEEGKSVLVYTNGRHIFSVREGEKRKKLVDTEFCLKVGGVFDAGEERGLYDFF